MNMMHAMYGGMVFMYKLNKHVLSSAIATFALSSLLISNQAAAQIEEVVVTARKVKETLQEVPLSIKTFSADQMEKSGFANLEDVAANTPGLNYSGGPSSGYQSSPVIRGQRQGFTQSRVQNVAVFLDGVYLSRTSMANVGLLDVRLEVLKGPQNTQFGRNAFSGAIKYETEKPGEEFEGYVATTKGSGGRDDRRISMSGPLIDGLLLGRFTYGESFYDGHTKNDHPNAGIDTPGFSDGGSDKLLGGYDDKTYNVGLVFNPTDTISFNMGFFKTELKRESQPGYYIGGVREVARFQTTPFGDMNGNEVTLQTLFSSVQGSVLNSTGNTMWFGALPLDPGKGVWIGGENEAGVQDFNWGWGNPGNVSTIVDDPKLPGVINDPRGFGFQANTNIMSFGFDWDISEDWVMTYKYGKVDHDGTQVGAAERDQLTGSIIVDGGDNAERIDQDIQSNVTSTRPVVDTQVESHEFRFAWNGSDRWAAAFGGFYSDLTETTFSRTTYNPICTTDDFLIDQDQDPISGCFLGYANDAAQANSPLVLQQENVAIFDLFGNQWSNNAADLTVEDEIVKSFFAQAEWFATPDLTFRLEGRYTKEEKETQRLTDSFAIPRGGSYQSAGLGAEPTFSSICAPGETVIGLPGQEEICNRPEDAESFYYFTPKAEVKWQYAEDKNIYAYAAKGLKSGGFNNTSDIRQATYDEEENWTYEIGSKNTFMDGKLRVNGAVYYVDWDNYVGGQTPIDAGNNPNASTVQANIGDVENYGFETDIIYQFNDRITLNFGASYSDPTYEDGTTYIEAKTNYYYKCTEENLLTDTNPDGSRIGGNFDNVINTDENCGDDRIGGNELPGVSKQQYTWGMVYQGEFGDGWEYSFNLNGNYRNRQWLTPLNVGYIKSRTLWNASLNLSTAENWDITFWGKNIFNKEYVSGAFNLSLFNKFLVSYGAEPEVGLNIKYKFYDL